ncbi:MAG: diaminopimelate epimerase [Acidimicrobiales bacterium]
MTSQGRRLDFSKHEGAGNDFLVLVDRGGRFALGDAEVRALCDRHRGIGADGVIVVRLGSAGAEVTMELRNADGGRAEMSGNGIRCLAQAAVDAGLVGSGRFTVATDAGLRTVEYRPAERPGSAWASVAMGEVVVGEEEPQPVEGRRARRVDVGNPHLVLLGPDPDAVDVATIGRRLGAAEPGGINVEFVAAGPGRDELRLRVWERGVGETLACGTGSCAAAAAAHRWGLVGERVRVHNPGGVLEVVLGHEAGDPVLLAGPVRRVAEVTVDLDLVASR